MRITPARTPSSAASPNASGALGGRAAVLEQVDVAHVQAGRAEVEAFGRLRLAHGPLVPPEHAGEGGGRVLGVLVHEDRDPGAADRVEHGDVPQVDLVVAARAVAVDVGRAELQVPAGSRARPA